MSSPSKLPAARRTGLSRSRPMSMFEVPTDHLKRLKQLGDSSSNLSNDDSTSADGSTTSKQSKRRSLLPTFSRKASGEAKPQMDKESITTIKEDTSDSEVMSRPSTQDGAKRAEDSKQMPPPPRPTARGSSLRLPTGRGTAAHARTASKGAIGSTSSKAPGQTSPPSSPPKTDLGHRRTDSARMHQSRMGVPPTPSAPSAPSTQKVIPTRGSSTNAATSATTSKRSSVAVSKPSPLDTTAVAPAPTQPSPTSPASSTATSRSRQNSRSQLQPPSRPSFSTYQQHYSPAKSALPKPPVPTTKAPKQAGPAEVEIVLTAENALEQVELLQLTLLHQSAIEGARDFEVSAKRKLGKKHAKLCKDYESICVGEREQRRVANLSALETWCPDKALLTESLQTLSRLVTDLQAQSAPGSRFSDLTETFEKWVANAQSILSGSQPATFIDALPESWRAAHTSVALKLRSFQRDISTLPPIPPRSGSEPPSSLEVLLRNSSALGDTMLRELEIMTKLQKQVLQAGKVHIDDQINALVRASDAAKPANKQGWRPIWQSVT